MLVQIPTCQNVQDQSTLDSWRAMSPGALTEHGRGRASVKSWEAELWEQPDQPRITLVFSQSFPQRRPLSSQNIPVQQVRSQSTSGPTRSSEETVRAGYWEERGQPHLASVQARPFQLSPGEQTRPKQLEEATWPLALI